MKTNNLVFLLLSYFFVLFNYPIVRASSITHFFEIYGAKSSPQAWLVAILMLIGSVWLSNRIQSRLGFKKTFVLMTLVSFMVSVVSYVSVFYGFNRGSFIQFAWKEVYIVLQVHLILAYANTWMTRDELLKWIGPLGAIGSVGGIFGGVLTSYLASHVDLFYIFILGQIFVLAPIAFVWQLTSVQLTQAEIKQSPFTSLSTSEIKTYVALICGIIFLSQVVINISDFQFSLIFEKMISRSQDRTLYLGHLYTLTNLLTLIFQLLFVPWLLKKARLSVIHFVIPLSYLICLLLGLNLGALMSSALFYVFIKAADYSFFSSSKELLYQPMKPLQKYGAKYITDMLVYRSSKALIAGVLIYLQDPEILFWVTLIALAVWMILVKLLFGFHRKFFQ